ncbi:Cytoplasmic dynein 1 intermediate chain 2 [Nymphon striatum]|nr:Cytoplasmic dynein 1 intermediate chain 2 [Nymphon striatum]
MADRKAELERKKQKLAAIREEKERRRKEKESRENEEKLNKGGQKDLRTEAEELLSSLGIPGVDSSPRSSVTATPEPSLSPAPDNSIPTPASPARVPKKKTKLSVVNVHQANIPPKENVTYTKQTQTTAPSLDREVMSPKRKRCAYDAGFKLKVVQFALDCGNNRKTEKLNKNQLAKLKNQLAWATDIILLDGVRLIAISESRSGVIFVLMMPVILTAHLANQTALICHTCMYNNIKLSATSFIRLFILTYDDIPGEDESSASHDSSAFNKVASGLPQAEMVKPPVTAEEEIKNEENKSKAHDLSDEEKQQIIVSENFNKFFDRTSRIIERALDEEIDYFIDYTGASGEDGDGDDKSGMKVSLNRCFFDDRWSKNRTVTCMDWSTQFPELLVASYNNNEESPHDPDGVALIWNMKFKKTTPEYIFHCQSPVMSATFAKFHPNLIIGGTYSGQIVLWDNRSNKRTPVQRSPLTAAAHTHPVYCAKVVGTQNAHNLISISTDGKFCSWSLDMLSAPQDSMELQHKQSKAVAVTSLSFPPGDVNNFAIGSEEGSVYTACRHGSKAGILDSFEGHQGPVTGIDIHNSQGQIDFSHLFLTSSFDWTIKLWSLKENKYLYSFEDNGDYVYDVSWSPIHPALFAAVDGMGRIDLWNLNNDTEVPTAGVIVDGAPALNRVTWTPSGHQVAAGDDYGRIWVHDVGEQLAVPRSDEWSKFVHTLQEIKNNQADEELDGLSSFSSLSTAPLR